MRIFELRKLQEEDNTVKKNTTATYKRHELLEVKVAVLVEIRLTKQLCDQSVGKGVRIPGLQEALLNHHQGHGAALVCILLAPELLSDSQVSDRDGRELQSGGAENGCEKVGLREIAVL